MQISQFLGVFIPDSTAPKWLVSEEKCNELFKFCQGQVANFLIEYIPLLFDLPDIIAPLKRGYEKEETQAVITHFWKGTLSIDLISKEVEKEHSAQRYKTSRKIYLGLKNSDGVIMTNKGAIYECRWNDEMKKYVPKSENPDASNATLEWQLPKDLQKERYEKGKDYIIVAKNDDSNQTRICKIDLCNFDSKLLYTKRKYGNT
uniref:Uncharacterized protein n=1 Tax=Panagrolaimus sp. ES5 TaxID=591445 RepID=A0AC34F9F9_9BILA